MRLRNLMWVAVLIAALTCAVLVGVAANPIGGAVTAKAGSGGVTAARLVALSAAGTIVTATDPTDKVVGVCEQTASADGLTKYAPAGTVTGVTSGEAIAVGDLVQAGTAGKAFVFAPVAGESRRSAGVALTAASAADETVTITLSAGGGGSLDAIDVYTIDATAQYDLGTRYVLADGRVYRYAEAGTAGWAPGYGAFFMCTLAIGENVHVAATAGDTTIVIEQASIAADAWKDGYIVVGHGSRATTQNRRVVSNTASATSTNHVTVTLDGALTANLTTGSYCEIIPNPYADLQTTTSEYAGVAGVPAAVATTGQFGWVQTWGPCWIVPGGAGTPGSTAAERELYFVGDCSVNGRVGMVAEATEAHGRQAAGFIIQKDSSGAGGPPFVMLQISP